MKILLISRQPSILISVEAADGSLVQTQLSLPEKEGFQLAYDPATLAPALLDPIVQWLTLYAKRKNSPFPLPLDTSLNSPFTKQVWKQLQKIPFGQTASYADLAVQVKNPKAARAVGNACGANPFPLFIPCHRVLATGGKLGGFSCGIEIKKRLLAFEEIPYTEKS